MCIRDRSGTGHVIMADPNTNVLFNKTAIPSIKYKINKGITVVETIVK